MLKRQNELTAADNNTLMKYTEFFKKCKESRETNGNKTNNPTIGLVQDDQRKNNHKLTPLIQYANNSANAKTSKQ